MPRDLLNKLLNAFILKIQGGMLSNNEVLVFLELYVAMVRRNEDARNNTDSVLLVQMVHQSLEAHGRYQQFSLHEIAGIIWVFANLGTLTANDADSRERAGMVDSLLKVKFQQLIDEFVPRKEGEEDKPYSQVNKYDMDVIMHYFSAGMRKDTRRLAAKV